MTEHGRVITKAEFIDSYLARSGLTMTAKTERGYVADGLEHEALECRCDDESCEGWSMELTAESRKAWRERR